MNAQARSSDGFSARTAFDNYSLALVELDRLPDAASDSDEAVRVYRQLAELAPARFEPDLAIALYNLGRHLDRLGRPEAAIAVKRSVEIRRRLVQSNSVAFKGDLAVTLNSLANRLLGVGRLTEARAAATDAVAIYRELAEINLNASRQLAGSLYTLGRTIDIDDDALEVIRESVDLWREVARVTPEVDPDGRAMALHAFAARLAARCTEPVELTIALRAADESVAAYGLAAERSPNKICV